ASVSAHLRALSLSSCAHPHPHPFPTRRSSDLALSAHAQVAGISSEMAAPERRQALEQADHYFSRARALYPQDVFAAVGHAAVLRSEEHTSELQSRENLVCRLLLEKKNNR